MRHHRLPLIAVPLLAAALTAPVQGQRANIQISERSGHAVSTSGKGSDPLLWKSHSIVPLTFNLGVFTMGGDQQGTFKAAPGFELQTGARVDRRFQLDASLSMAFGAAGLSKTIQTTIGPRSTMDHETFISLGARFILPKADESVLFGVGGGWTFAAYSEDAGDITKETIYCTSCAAETTGQGGYGLAELDVFLDRERSVGLSLIARGVTVRMQDYFLNRPVYGRSERPTDSWMMLTAGVIYRF